MGRGGKGDKGDGKLEERGEERMEWMNRKKYSGMGVRGQW